MEDRPLDSSMKSNAQQSVHPNVFEPCGGSGAEVTLNAVFIHIAADLQQISGVEVTDTSSPQKNRLLRAVSQEAPLSVATEHHELQRKRHIHEERKRNTAHIAISTYRLAHCKGNV